MNYGIPSIKKIPLNNNIEYKSALFNFNRVNKFYKKELLESLIKINKNINKEVLLSENCCISKIFTDNIMSNLSLKIHNIRKNLTDFGSLEELKNTLNTLFNASAICNRIHIGYSTKNNFYGITIIKPIEEIKNDLINILNCNRKEDGDIEANKQNYSIILDNKLLENDKIKDIEIAYILINEISISVISKLVDLNFVSKLAYEECIANLNSNSKDFNYDKYDSICKVYPIMVLPSVIMKCVYMNSFISKIYKEDIYNPKTDPIEINSVIIKIKSIFAITPDYKAYDTSNDNFEVWARDNSDKFEENKFAVINAINDLLKETNGSDGNLAYDIYKYMIECLKSINNTSEEEKDEIVSESIKSFFEMRRKGISYEELDEIKVEMDSIEDYDDKIYVISKIHKDIGITNSFIDKLKKKNPNDSKIQQYEDFIKNLLRLLDEARKIRIRPKEYGLFVKYSIDDYENGLKVKKYKDRYDNDIYSY